MRAGMTRNIMATCICQVLEENANQAKAGHVKAHLSPAAFEEVHRTAAA